jgi:type I site-specific restriction-modification system R (restriction) subunit
LKIFDCFTEATLDMLALLSSFYKKVYITKPNTSRSANSEKYVVCKGFLYNSNSSFYPFIYKTFKQILQPNIVIRRFLPQYPIPYYFLTKIEEYNSIFGQQQIENIHYTLSLMDSKPKQEKIDSIIKTNVQKCMYWCIKHNIQYNILFRDIPIDNPPLLA